MPIVFRHYKNNIKIIESKTLLRNRDNLRTFEQNVCALKTNPNGEKKNHACAVVSHMPDYDNMTRTCKREIEITIMMQNFIRIICYVSL